MKNIGKVISVEVMKDGVKAVTKYKKKIFKLLKKGANNEYNKKTQTVNVSSRG